MKVCEMVRNRGKIAFESSASANSATSACSVSTSYSLITPLCLLPCDCKAVKTSATCSEGQDSYAAPLFGFLQAGASVQFTMGGLYHANGSITAFSSAGRNRSSLSTNRCIWSARSPRIRKDLVDWLRIPVPIASPIRTPNRPAGG